MKIYTHAIQALERDGNWITQPNHAGTWDSSGTPEQYARRMLNRYLADVADDAEMLVGEFGSAPILPTRVMVWAGRKRGADETAVAELRTEAAPDTDQFVIAFNDDSPSPVTGRVIRSIGEEHVAVAWGEEQDKLHPVTRIEAIDEMTSDRARS